AIRTHCFRRGRIRAASSSGIEVPTSANRERRAPASPPRSPSARRSLPDPPHGDESRPPTTSLSKRVVSLYEAAPPPPWALGVAFPAQTRASQRSSWFGGW